jgi:hypothetical protein
MMAKEEERVPVQQPKNPKLAWDHPPTQPNENREEAE